MVTALVNDREATLRQRLADSHLISLLEESGIDPEVVLLRGYRTVNCQAELGDLGFPSWQQRAPALLIPMYSPSGTLVTHQIKPDNPRYREDKSIKYETPGGSGVHLDVHPSQTERVKDPKVPLWVTEGVKKGDCLVSHGQCAVALQGVWCWQKGGAALPEWEDIKLHGRVVYVAFDSDVMTKTTVQAALEGLVDHLRLRGASVKVVYLSEGGNGEKQGVDDYLASGGTIEELRVMAEDDLREDLDAIDGLDTVSRKLPNAVDFPVEALPKTCQKLVRMAAVSIGCPPEFVALPMLVALGSAIGNSRVIKLKEGWEESAALYGAIVAEPGEKKSPALKTAVRPAIRKQAILRDIYRQKQDQYKRELREYEVDKKDAAQNGLAAPPPPHEPMMERTVVEDTTVEALAVVLEGTPRGVLVMRDELTAWLRSMDQYKAGGRGSDRQFWLSAWSHHYASVDRKGKGEPVMLQRPFVSVVGSIQPGVMPELGKSREDGLLDRFLFAYPEPAPSRWSDAEIGPEALAAYESLYDRLRGLRMSKDDHGDPNPTPVVFAREAREVFKEIVNQHREEMDGPGFPMRLKGIWSKLEGYLGRLCLVLALCRSVEEDARERVEKRDVLCAFALLNYFKNQARRVYAGLYGENATDRLAEDVACFLSERGGRFKDEPSVLHMELRSDFKPARPDELTKKLRSIASRTPTLDFDTGNFWKEGQSRRYVALTLSSSVNGVKDDRGEFDSETAGGTATR